MIQAAKLFLLDVLKMQAALSARYFKVSHTQQFVGRTSRSSRKLASSKYPPL